MSPPDAPQDQTAALVASASRGDRPSLDTLLQHYLPRLRAFVRLRVDAALRARESRSDLVQSTCREVLAHQEGFVYRDEASFRSWLFTTALNKIREHGRHHRAQRRDVQREEPVEAAEAELASCYARLPSPSQAAIAGETAARLEAAFDALPEDYREVIALSRVVGLPRAEVARAMGRSEASVRMLLSRALVALLAKVEGRSG